MNRRIVVLMVCLLVAMTGFGQKCKFKVDKVDPITGKKTQGISLKAAWSTAVGYLRVGDSIYIEGVAYMPGEQNFDMPKGSLMDVKLGNDSILFLPSHATIKPATSVMSIGNSPSVHTSYVMRYVLTKEQAAMIKTVGIQFLRMHMQADHAYDMTFDKKDIAKSIAAANCIF